MYLEIPQLERAGIAGEPAETQAQESRAATNPAGRAPDPACGVVRAITAPKFCFSAQGSAPHWAKIMRFFKRTTEAQQTSGWPSKSRPECQCISGQPTSETPCARLTTPAHCFNSATSVY